MTEHEQGPEPEGQDSSEEKTDMDAVAASLRQHAKRMSEVTRAVSNLAAAGRVALRFSESVLSPEAKTAIEAAMRLRESPQIRKAFEAAMRVQLSPETKKTMDATFELPPETKKAIERMTQVQLSPEATKAMEAMLELSPETKKSIRAMTQVQLSPETTEAIKEMTRTQVPPETKKAIEWMTQVQLSPETNEAIKGMGKSLLLAGQAAKMLGVSRERLRQLSESDVLRPIAVTSTGRLFDRDQVERLRLEGWEGRRSRASRRCAAESCQAVGEEMSIVLLGDISIRVHLCDGHRGMVERKDQSEDDTATGGYL